jgi:hypothetical protein
LSWLFHGGANQFFGCLDHRVPLCKAARSVQRRLLKSRECVDGVPYRPSDRCARRGCATSEEAMTTFDKREEGFEKQFARDEELRFKATARRNKHLGLWAAQKLGLSGAEADAYAKEVVLADFEEAGDHDVFRKIRKDFDAKGVKDSDHQIQRTMVDLMAKAIEEIRTGR